MSRQRLSLTRLGPVNVREKRAAAPVLGGSSEGSGPWATRSSRDAAFGWLPFSASATYGSEPAIDPRGIVPSGTCAAGAWGRGPALPAATRRNGGRQQPEQGKAPDPGRALNAPSCPGQVSGRTARPAFASAAGHEPSPPCSPVTTQHERPGHARAIDSGGGQASAATRRTVGRWQPSKRP
jgi:hypothetical protein